MAEVEIIAEQRQAGKRRDGDERQRQPQGTAAGSALLPCFGKQQPEQEVHDREEQRKAQQPGDAVDGLLGQGDGVEIELALAVVVQRGGQIIELCAAADPQPGSQGAVAVIQPQGVGADRRGNHGAGKAQRTGGVEHIEGGRVGRLAGEILHRHLIRAGPHRLPGRRKIQRVTGLEVRLVPHLEVIPLVGGNVREGVLEQVGGHRQLVRRTEQPGRQHAEHGQLHRQQGSEQPVALAESKEMFHP